MTKMRSIHGIAWVLFAAIPFLLSNASGDTVKFKDGSSVDGIVTQPNPDTIIIQVGKAKMTFTNAEVESVEKNDKKGEEGKTIDMVAKRHNDYIEQRTGLSREQRDAVRKLTGSLRSEDEAERNAARRKLVEMGKSARVFDYIETSLPFVTGAAVPQLMQTLVEMDPERAANVVAQRVGDLDPRNRGKAIELMATYKKPENTETIARGIVDLDPNVRVAAAHALASCGDKAVTPALIKGLSDPDPRVQNASRSALQSLWSDGGTTVDFTKPEEWNTFWSSKSGNVKNAVDATKLAPLITQEDLAGATPDHDE